MYTVIKTVEISGAHFLNLPYSSKCTKTHGHNWIIEVTCQSKKLDENGMVTDFSRIKEIINRLDHTFLNEILPEFNPTAENIARWLCGQVPRCVRVKIQESEGNVAIYESD